MNPTQTETLSRVQGRLEGYERAIKVLEATHLDHKALAHALREDAQALSSVLEELAEEGK